VGPLSLISAMLEPCASRGQAVVTIACFTILGSGVFAGSYACYMYAEAARETIPQMNFDSLYDRRRSGVDQTMYMFYALSGLLAIGSALFMVSATVVGIRSFFPTQEDD
jgi:hypothetical protein